MFQCHLWLCLVVSLVFHATANGAVLLQFNFSGNLGNEASEPAVNVAPGITAFDLVRGAGLTAGGASGTTANTFQSLSWGGTDADDYLSFSFSVSVGNLVDLETLTLNSLSTGAGPGTLGLFYSGDSFVTSLYTFNQSGSNANITTGNSIDLATLTNLSGIVEFRIREIGDSRADNSGVTSNGGAFRISNFGASPMTLSGSITAVPEPSSLACLGLLKMVGAGVVRRRKQSSTP